VDGLVGIVVGRIVSGLASAIPTVVLGGSIEDMWNFRARIWVIDLWVLAGVFGIGTAPSYATIIASYLGW
jgi:hypothetical protein